jgi:hypothetical protein
MRASLVGGGFRLPCADPHAITQIKYHFVQTTGVALGWTVVYYIFTLCATPTTPSPSSRAHRVLASVKTMMRVTVFLLMGAGWTLLKPFLSDRERRIILVVLPLQLVANVAVVVVNEMLPGAQGWVTWISASMSPSLSLVSLFGVCVGVGFALTRRHSGLFYLLDLACSVAVILPIVWSIRFLRETSASDDKGTRL